MKIQCDVCSKKEASVFCSADEAALCDVCDQRVHHANKLASKHYRFSLIHPSSCHAPICDICQEKRALLFCQQDRAILCRECDIPVHTANEHTQKHNRFLLTGVKLSASKISDTSNKVLGVGDGCGTILDDFESTKKQTPEIPSLTSSAVTSSSNSTNNNIAIDNQFISSGPTCNISDYMADMLPGWHFDDLLLDPPSSAPASYGFSKSINNNGFEVREDMLSFFDLEHDKNFTSYASHQFENFWVPQAPAAAAAATSVFGQPSIFHSTSSAAVHGTKLQETSVNATKVSRKCRRDDACTVPQITSSVGSKRSRPLW